MIYNPGQTQSLNVGTNQIDVILTSQDGTVSNVYQIFVVRENLSMNASLAALSVSEGSLIPAFSSEIMEYSIVGYAPQDRVSISISASTSHSNAVVSYPSGQALTAGSNQLIVRVTAEDGLTMKDYVIRVL